MKTTLETLQQVLFDLHDARNNRLLTLRKGARLPQEFDSIDDWLSEQIAKISAIESELTETL